jgi:hypothetical protein
MDPDEIVPSEVQAISGPEVIPFLAEGIRQARQSAHLHSDGEVLAFDD